MSDWKSVVGLIAPKIGAALGGPLGGQATKMVLRSLGMSPESSEDELATFIDGADPEMLLKIKTAEIDFDKFCIEADVDLERIAAGDRASARERQVKTKDKTPAILGGVITAGFFSMIVLLFVLAIKGVQVDPVVMATLQVLLGTLGTVFIMVCTYFYGSSTGSKQKTANIHELKNGVHKS